VAAAPDALERQARVSRSNLLTALSRKATHGASDDADESAREGSGPTGEEAIMAGGSKPKPGSKRKATFQGGAKTSGTTAKKHAGPGRKSKTAPQGTRGKQTQRRKQP
jgi:hypothetical protein